MSKLQRAKSKTLCINVEKRVCCVLFFVFLVFLQRVKNNDSIRLDSGRLLGPDSDSQRNVCGNGSHPETHSTAI